LATTKKSKVTHFYMAYGVN